MKAPACPTTRQGWWDYSGETDRLINETGRLVFSWRYFLPWNMWKVRQRHLLVRARLEQQKRAMEDDWFGFS